MTQCKVNILFAPHRKGLADTHFPEYVMDEMRKLGNVIFDKENEDYSVEEFAEKIRDADICVTHWNSPSITPDILDKAHRLKMICHCAGTVFSLLCDEVYKRGIRVCGANSVMARYVAEGTLLYMLAGLRRFVNYDKTVKAGPYIRNVDKIQSLIGQKVGFIGLGTVGFHLLDFLKPFNVEIKIYDPYLKSESLPHDMKIELCGSLEEVLSWAGVITMHASKTPETYHMLNADNLKLLKDGAVFVNTSRGANVDEEALVDELKTGRIYAVLDVYEEEPLPITSRLRSLENVALMPHLAGSPAKEKMTLAMIDEIRRFLNNEPLKFEIPYEKYKLMTR